MSWVLILNSDINAKPPAVVGGYVSREEAENAGELATRFEFVKGALNYFKPPDWTSYTVIPGAACSGPLGSTIVRKHRDFDGSGPIIREERFRI